MIGQQRSYFLSMDMGALDIFTVTTGSQATVEKEKRKRAARVDGQIKAARVSSY